MAQRLVVNFHGIGPPPAWADDDERRVWCTKATFLSLLDRIPDVSAEMHLPIELTFDDGNASDLTMAMPALLKRGMRAAFFVCAGRIGRPGYLDAAHLLELSRAGMTIGSHGWDHVDWRRLADARALDREVRQAREFIAGLMAGQPVDSVAIPFGSYDGRVARAVAPLFPMVYTSDGGHAASVAQVVPRESYTVRWNADTLRRLAAPSPAFTRIRQVLARAYKWRRRSPADLDRTT